VGLGSGRHALTVEIAGSNPARDTVTVLPDGAGGWSAKSVLVGSIPTAVSVRNCVGLALVSHPGCNPAAERLCRFDSCPTHCG
jgi:hypothetical protein